MIKVNPKKREIQDTIWTVIETFGFIEVENNEGFYEDSKKEPGKYYYFQNDVLTAVNSQEITEKAKAELVALCVEIAMVCGKENAKIKVSDEKVAGMLCLFGFENIIEIGGTKEEVSLESMGKTFAKAKFADDYAEITLNLNEFLSESPDFDRVQASLLYAEEDAEGYSYEVAYNLRMNGCIVELYTGTGTIDDAVSYTKDKGMGCILRVFSGGKLMINDFAKNEIIETTVEDFLGYYDDDEDEEECECGCGGHHHHHDHGTGMH